MTCSIHGPPRRDDVENTRARRDKFRLLALDGATPVVTLCLLTAREQWHKQVGRNWGVRIIPPALDRQSHQCSAGFCSPRPVEPDIDLNRTLWAILGSNQ